MDEKKKPVLHKYAVQLRHSRHRTGWYVCMATDEDAAKKQAKSAHPEGEVCGAEPYDAAKHNMPRAKGGN